MDPDDEVCLCFHVSLRKIRTFLEREKPEVASLISDCLGAGTGCRWCVPFLKELHRQHETGEGLGPSGEPDLRVSPEQYANSRAAYRRTGERPPTGTPQGESDATV
ncbi:MAG TPA: (2Fe-2S)-binding protein [Phycisphaerales bacterium]|nr:(2Fe-2S)-binding protein [Phycisphaerales bacterium]